MLNHIKIVNWKGHKEINLSFDKGVNFLTGPNGIGKTSILDAINYAFLGTIKFMGSYHGIGYGDLVRDPAEECEICLSFTDPKGESYELTRRIGSSRRALLETKGKAIATTWQDVTNRVLKLYKASDVFLGRCVFLTEGETYEYINRPPGEGLAKHIASVLGIDTMENLASVFDTLYKKYSDTAKNLRTEIEGVQVATDEDKKIFGQLTEEIKRITDERRILTEEVIKLDKEHDALLREVESLQNWVGQIIVVMSEWQKHFAPLVDKKDPISIIATTNRQIENDHKTLTAKRNRLLTEIGKLSALAQSEKSVVEMISRVPEAAGQNICPVCKRPLTMHMIKQISDECSQIIKDSEKSQEELEKQSKIIEGEMEENRKKLNILGGLESKIRSILKDGPRTLSTVEIEKKGVSLNEKASLLPEKTDELKENVSKLDQRIIELRAKQSHIQEKIDPERIKTQTSSLFSATKIEFLSQAFLTSIQDSLAKQRNIMLTPLMEELSAMWGRFMNRPIKVQMRKNCELSIVDERHHTPFKFPQLSGGEKTALLILTHILLCKYFSDSDFMLLDEPLEHLDSRNRWALVNFIVQYCKQDTPEQLVVTTIEEQYLREYMGDEMVHVTKLG